MARRGILRSQAFRRGLGLTRGGGGFLRLGGEVLGHGVAEYRVESGLIAIEDIEVDTAVIAAFRAL
jgi:hypothetical protein